MLEAIMALVFIAIDPDTTGDHCPAVAAALLAVALARTSQPAHHTRPT
jgi:hypothetical protein